MYELYSEYILINSTIYRLYCKVTKLSLSDILVKSNYDNEERVISTISFYHRRNLRILNWGKGFAIKIFTQPSPWTGLGHCVACL